MEWLGRARTGFHHAPSPVSLPLKEPNAKGSASLSDFVKSVTPPCNLTPSLPGGDVQTVYGAVFHKGDTPLNYKRRIWHSDHQHYDGTFAVDFLVHLPDELKTKRDEGLPPRTTNYTEDEWTQFSKGSDDARPMVVLLHGLSGGSYEQYLKETVAPLVDQSSELPFEAVVVNSRGCARSKITTPRLFNARSTWDVRQVIKWLRKTFPNRPLFAVGFSLGANILVNAIPQYLGEEGDKCELKAAVACSNPWDLAAASIDLRSTYVGREIYSKTFAKNLKHVFSKHADVLKQNPDLDIENVMKSKYLHEFDTAIQCPLWGYPTVGAYYRDAASTEPLLGVRIPLLAVNAEDDPVAPKSALPYDEVKQNPYAVMITTSMGGHLSWFQPDGERWFIRPTTGFLRKFAQQVNLQQSPIVDTSGKTLTGKLPTYDPIRRKLAWPGETSIH